MQAVKLIYYTLIFSKCLYRAPIRYFALTKIFLNHTAALRKKVPASKLFLNIYFFLICWNKVFELFLILHMLSQHWPATFVVLAGESVTLHCDSRPSCTTSWSVWASSARLVPPYHPLLFSYSLRCHVKWCGRVACLFHMRSASPRLSVLNALLYETHKTS